LRRGTQESRQDNQRSERTRTQQGTDNTVHQFTPENRYRRAGRRLWTAARAVLLTYCQLLISPRGAARGARQEAEAARTSNAPPV
jgi:hypothetical protein